MAEQYPIVYMYYIFIHCSVDGHLDCFRVLAIVNSTAVNIGLCVSFWIMVFFRYMPRSDFFSGIADFIFGEHS